MATIALNLTATRNNRKLIALAFIKDYFADHGVSPSMSEIAAALDTNKARASAIVHQLAAEQMISHARGKARGIGLNDPAEQVSERDALRRLQAAGWKINVTTGRLERPPVTEPGLTISPDLAHIPDVEIGSGWNDGHRKRRPGRRTTAAG